MANVGDYGILRDVRFVDIGRSFFLRTGDPEL